MRTLSHRSQKKAAMLSFSHPFERNGVLKAFFNSYLFWGALLLTTVLAASAERHKPLPHQIERVKNEYDSVLWDCSASDCPHGTGLSVKCGTSVPYNASIECEICESGKTYSDTHNFDTCKDCLICKENQVQVSGECTLEQDSTKCECKHGYYDDGNGDCKMCSHCCGDDRNLHVAGCDDMPPNQRCGAEHAGNCVPTTEHVTHAIRRTTSVESANKLTYVGFGAAGTTGGILLVFLFFLFLWCKSPTFKQKMKGMCLRHSSDPSRATSGHLELDVTRPLVLTTNNESPAGQLEVVTGGPHSPTVDNDCISVHCEVPVTETLVTVADNQGLPREEDNVPEAPVQGAQQEVHEVPEACLVAIDDDLPNENNKIQILVVVDESCMEQNPVPTGSSQGNAPQRPKLQSQKSHQPAASDMPSHSLQRFHSHPGAHKESKQEKKKDNPTLTEQCFSQHGYNMCLPYNNSGGISSAEASESGMATFQQAHKNPDRSLEVPKIDQHTSTTDLQARVTSSSQQKLAAAKEKVLAMRTSDIPITLLKKLSLRLNNKEQYVSDYRHLAEKIGIEPSEIWALDRSADPTNDLLQYLGGKKEGRLSKLVEYLKEMDRFDAVDIIDNWVEEQCLNSL